MQVNAFVINALKMRPCRLMFAPSAIASPLRKADPPYLLVRPRSDVSCSPRFSIYWLARTALNVPCFEGRSPTSGEKSTSPVIKSGVSNFPLHVNVPASRPTLPIRNSTGPENVTEFRSPGVHFASEGLAPPKLWIADPSPSKCLFHRFVHQSAGNDVAR